MRRHPPPVESVAEHPLDLDDPLVLPVVPTRSSQGPVPWAASVVPVLGAVGLWLATGSAVALWFAALGPVIAVATVLDRRRGARAERRGALAAAAAARERVAITVARRHATERRDLWVRHPDVVRRWQSDDIWRAGASADVVVIGAGEAPSATRVVGGDGDPEAGAVRARAAVLDRAPVTVSAAEGIAVSGPAIVVAGVVRALALQLCLTHPPGELRVVGGAGGEDWIDALPHRRARAGRVLAVCGPGEPVPLDADLVIAHAPDGVRLRCAVAVAVDGSMRARVVVEGRAREIEVEAVGRDQAHEIARALGVRTGSSLDLAPPPDAPVALERLLGATHDRHGLCAVVGATADTAARPVAIDLVSDGPHAVVGGMTGSGKSELLTTWVTSMCATRTTAEVSFLLADFKGGTAFETLASLPHVTGVITDLQGAGARRAIESLRAEVRWREAELVRVGARDVDDPRVRMPRLVVVVDEFAALVAALPELHAVFTDVAARGRALGIHLVLGTQRVAGTVRDGLLANCPLRISLRVADVADSRAVVGTDEAALLPGGDGGRGVAVVRRAADDAPERVRIAMAGADLVSTVAAADAGPPPRRPWLPALPARLDLDALRAHAGELAPGELLVALADEPERQRQVPMTLTAAERGLAVVGTAGTGRTTALEAVAAQLDPSRCIRVAADPERAWDTVLGLEEACAAGAVVLVDDLDALLGRYPLDYARVLGERVETLVRDAGSRGIRVVVSAQRLAGPVAHIADLLPRRVVLGAASRAEHIALGGEPRAYDGPLVPGRGHVDGREVQVAMPVRRDRADRDPGAPARMRRDRRDRGARDSPEPVAPLWTPRTAATGVVARAGSLRAVAEALAGEGVRIVPVEAADADDVLADAAPRRTPSSTPGAPGVPAVVVLGGPEEWQRAWRVLGAMRSAHDLVVDARCGADLRVLTGERELPPYCVPGRGRGWRVDPSGAVRRVVVPGLV